MGSFFSCGRICQRQTQKSRKGAIWPFFPVTFLTWTLMDWILEENQMVTYLYFFLNFTKLSILIQKFPKHPKINRQIAPMCSSWPYAILMRSLRFLAMKDHFWDHWTVEARIRRRDGKNKISYESRVACHKWQMGNFTHPFFLS